MAGRQRTSFEKRERERKRQEKQAAKRARRHHDAQPSPEESRGEPDVSGDVSDAERIQSAEG
jgi:hypothetical protein